VRIESPGAWARWDAAAGMGVVDHKDLDSWFLLNNVFCGWATEFSLRSLRVP